MSGTDRLPSISANESFSIDSDVARRFCQENREIVQICGLLAYNKTYIELLDELIAKADEAVRQNRDAQKVVKDKLLRPDNNKPGKRRRRKDFGLHYRYPYFRDASGMVPAQNMESLELSRVCSFNPLTEEEKKWTEKELRGLREAVAQSLNEQQIIKLDAKKEVLYRKLRTAGVETTDEQMENWRGEVERIKNRTNYIRGRPVDEVIQEAKGDFSLVDWAKIASSVFQGTRSIIQLRQKWFCDMMLNQEPWTLEEDQDLLSLAADFSDWDSIAQHLKTGRSAFRCFQRHAYLQDLLKEKKPWTPEEDDKLLSYIRLFKVGEQIPWTKISMYMEGRPKKACEYRYERCTSEALRHGRWTEAEDMLLLHAINKYGPQNWARIASFVPGRTLLQCRDRWIHVLDHKRRDLPWGWEEHQRLLYGVELFGRSECAKISKLLPGRNNMDVRMRIRLLVKYKIEETMNPKKDVVFRHFAKNYLCCKSRRTSVVDKFQRYLETEQQSQKNQLLSRLGLGTYMVDFTDYTDVKKERAEKFGQWTVKGSGRWVRALMKNPNEYNSEDLMEELDKLPEEKREEAIEWLHKSDERLEQERQMEETIPEDPVEAKDFYERMYPKERLKELSEFVGKLLKPTQNDIAYFERHRVRPGHLKLRKVKGTQKRKGRQKRVKRRKNEKLARMLNGEDIEESDVIGMRWSDRMIAEINKSLEDLPQEKRREFVVRSLCNAVRQRVHQTNVTLLKSKPDYRDNIKTLVHDYIEQVVNDPIVPKPIKPKVNNEKVVLLPQNWHNLSLKEMMKLKLAPNIYPALVQQATLANNHLANFDARQENIDNELSLVPWKKRRRLEERKMQEGFRGGFKETVVCPMPEVQTLGMADNPKFNTQSEMYKQILSKLVPPCSATVNAMELFDLGVRARLTKLSLFSPPPTDESVIAETEGPSTSKQQPTQHLQRRTVPNNVRQSHEYAQLKKRIFRLFFLPLLMQRAIRPKEDGGTASIDPDLNQSLFNT
ncbi:hypothetical protein niasHS_012269 [Heterodera schachtii]|uniref:snRNA-activating protein complex subunit 4 n=1 Tax=Heterodera schachtii TaxID=97005 RepID=A0ABD2IE31_HETSC